MWSRCPTLRGTSGPTSLKTASKRCASSTLLLAHSSFRQSSFILHHYPAFITTTIFLHTTATAPGEHGGGAAQADGGVRRRVFRGLVQCHPRQPRRPTQHFRGCCPSLLQRCYHCCCCNYVFTIVVTVAIVYAVLYHCYLSNSIVTLTAITTTIFTPPH